MAVSGGVDSMCLLYLLVQHSHDYELNVAHFDHGIRADSHLDKQLVEAAAGKYRLPFYSSQGRLGENASEADARRARYKFLFDVRDKTGSAAIITAHHLDDRLETLVINLIRGTGRKGLGSIAETKVIKRPLLNVSKQELRNFARQHKLSWREDTTNIDTRYLRNYIRQQLADRLTGEDRSKLIEIMNRQAKLNQQIDREMRAFYGGRLNAELSRKVLANLTYNESKELIASWLRDNNLVNFDHKTIERITVAAKTKKPGTKLDVYGRRQVVIDKEILALDALER